MGLATIDLGSISADLSGQEQRLVIEPAIDPHSQKEHTEIHKIPKFGVYQASFDWDTAI